MSITSPLTEFCKNKGLPKEIQNAFASYVRTVYAKKYDLSTDGETIHIVIGRMDERQLEDAWQEFVKELYRHMPRQT